VRIVLSLKFWVFNFSILGYHYFVELVLDRDMAKTGGDIYVAIFSEYEMLANVTMTPKYV